MRIAARGEPLCRAERATRARIERGQRRGILLEVCDQHRAVAVLDAHAPGRPLSFGRNHQHAHRAARNLCGEEARRRPRGAGARGRVEQDCGEDSDPRPPVSWPQRHTLPPMLGLSEGSTCNPTLI